MLLCLGTYLTLLTKISYFFQWDIFPWNRLPRVATKETYMSYSLTNKLCDAERCFIASEVISGRLSRGMAMKNMVSVKFHFGAGFVNLQSTKAIQPWKQKDQRRQVTLKMVDFKPERRLKGQWQGNDRSPYIAGAPVMKGKMSSEEKQQSLIFCSKAKNMPI